MDPVQGHIQIQPFSFNVLGNYMLVAFEERGVFPSRHLCENSVTPHKVTSSNASVCLHPIDFVDSWYEIFQVKIQIHRT